VQRRRTADHEKNQYRSEHAEYEECEKPGEVLKSASSTRFFRSYAVVV
jgi:hypothetical protein